MFHVSKVETEKPFFGYGCSICKVYVRFTINLIFDCCFILGICLVQEMLQYSVLTVTRKLLIALGLFYVVLGVLIFADSEVLAIMKDITGKGL